METNYGSMKLELLALKWAVTEKFHDYLLAAEFLVYTDNNPFSYIKTAKLLCNRDEMGEPVVPVSLQHQISTW